MADAPPDVVAEIDEWLLEYSEVATEHWTNTRESIRRGFKPSPHEPATFVLKDSVIIKILRENADEYNVHMSNAQLHDVKWYKLSNDLAEKLLDKLYVEVLWIKNKALAAGINMDARIEHTRVKLRERADEERRAQAARDLDAERAQLDAERAQVEAERAQVESIRAGSLQGASRRANIAIPDEWPDEPTGVEEGNVCVVCLDRRAVTIFMPCGHMCLCVHCARRVALGDEGGRICAMCRDPFEQVVRVYGDAK